MFDEEKFFSEPDSTQYYLDRENLENTLAETLLRKYGFDKYAQCITDPAGAEDQHLEELVDLFKTIVITLGCFTDEYPFNPNNLDRKDTPENDIKVAIGNFYNPELAEEHAQWTKLFTEEFDCLQWLGEKIYSDKHNLWIESKSAELIKIVTDSELELLVSIGKAALVSLLGNHDDILKVAGIMAMHTAMINNDIFDFRVPNTLIGFIPEYDDYVNFLYRVNDTYDAIRKKGVVLNFEQIQSLWNEGLDDN